MFKKSIVMRKSGWVFFLIWFIASVGLGLKALSYMRDLSWTDCILIVAIAVIIGGAKGYFVLQKAAKKMIQSWTSQKKAVLLRFCFLLFIMQLLVFLLRLMQLSDFSMAIIDLSIALALLIGSSAFLFKVLPYGRSS